MRRLFEIAAARDGQVKTAILGALARTALGAIKSPLRTLGYVGAAGDLVGGAKKTEQIADQVSQSVAGSPQPFGPTM